ncbi:ISSpo9, transposase [Ruegeria sp. TrichCH4B]|nr:ISSpo9, transposase [Ruegeria sp. TrichCH4B]
MVNKIRIGVDEQTLEIRAIVATGSQVGDRSILPDLLGQISDVDIGSGTAMTRGFACSGLN